MGVVRRNVVKRNNDGVDAFERAMQGVHTSEDHRIVSYARDSGLIGSRSEVEVSVVNDTPPEREVIVKMRPVPRRPSRTPRP
jgi:hypothetical protein